MLTKFKKGKYQKYQNKDKLFIKQRQKDIETKGHFANVNSMPKDDSLKCPTSGTISRKIKKKQGFSINPYLMYGRHEAMLVNLHAVTWTIYVFFSNRMHYRGIIKLCLCRIWWNAIYIYIPCSLYSLEYTTLFVFPFLTQLFLCRQNPVLIQRG